MRGASQPLGTVTMRPFRSCGNARLRAQVAGVTPAQATAAARLEMLPVGHETRPVMAVAITVFTGQGAVADLLATRSTGSINCVLP